MGEREKPTEDLLERILRLHNLKASNEIITGRTGRKLECSIGENYITLKDIKEPAFFLSARIRPADKSINFSLYTRIVAKKPKGFSQSGTHPDLHPREFIATALKYFKIQNFEINTFEATFLHEEQFYKLISAEIAAGKSELEALSSISITRIASAFGFTEINPRDIRIGRNDIKVKYKLPN